MKNSNNYLTDSHKKISDLVKIAEHLNKFFCSIGEKLSDKIRSATNEEIKLPTRNSKSVWANLRIFFLVCFCVLSTFFVINYVLYVLQRSICKNNVF